MKTAIAASIELTLPLNKEYARVLRLAVAGIASRLKFNWEQIEDIKLAAEEAFLLALSRGKSLNIHFRFLVGPESIMIHALNVNLGLFDAQSYEQKYSLFIMTGLMDKVDITPRKENYFDIKLVKNVN